MIQFKLKTELPYEPVALSLSIYSDDLKSRSWRDICAPIFIAASATIAKIQTQSKIMIV